MSPTAALASDVFRIYLILIVAILVVAGAVLAVLRWGLRRDVGHAWKAYRGWLVMVPLLVGPIFLGRAATILFVTLVSIFGFKEYARATGLYRDWVMTTVVYLGIVAVGVVSLVPDPQLAGPAGMACLRFCRRMSLPRSCSCRLCGIVRKGNCKRSPWRCWASSTSAGCSAMRASWPTPTTPTAICST